MNKYGAQGGLATEMYNKHKCLDLISLLNILIVLLRLLLYRYDLIKDYLNKKSVKGALCYLRQKEWAYLSRLRLTQLSKLGLIQYFCVQLFTSL